MGSNEFGLIDNDIRQALSISGRQLTHSPSQSFLDLAPVHVHVCQRHGWELVIPTHPIRLVVWPKVSHSPSLWSFLDLAPVVFKIVHSFTLSLWSLNSCIHSHSFLRSFIQPYCRQ